VSTLEHSGDRPLDEPIGRSQSRLDLYLVADDAATGLVEQGAFVPPHAVPPTGRRFTKAPSVWQSDQRNAVAVDGNEAEQQLPEHRSTDLPRLGIEMRTVRGVGHPDERRDLPVDPETVDTAAQTSERLARRGISTVRRIRPGETSVKVEEPPRTAARLAGCGCDLRRDLGRNGGRLRLSAGSFGAPGERNAPWDRGTTGTVARSRTRHCGVRYGYRSVRRHRGTGLRRQHPPRRVWRRRSRTPPAVRRPSSRRSPAGPDGREPPAACSSSPRRSRRHAGGGECVEPHGHRVARASPA
jgi:hypothetical protein